MKNSKTSIIESKLQQRPLDSKKAIYGLIAGACVLVVFATSAFLIFSHAEVAKDITELANLVVMFFAAIATTLITGQAVVDFKGMSVLQHIDEDSNEEREENIQSNQPIGEVDIGRVHKPRYYDDGAV